ncbi:MAG: hypothetical protein WCG27_05995 [Pseudomonadota bacterium]
MSFKRQDLPLSWPIGNELTKHLIGIGIRLAGDVPTTMPNIEDTLVAGSIEGLAGDTRTLSLIVDWITIHYECLNVDRLFRVLKRERNNNNLIAFWSSIGKMHKKDSRFLKISKLYRGPKLSVLGPQTDFLIKRNGEDDRFVGTSVRIPAKALRHRPEDIETPCSMAQKHRGYYYRILVGASYRADILALLEQNASVSISSLAAAAYSSFKTAWDAKKDWELIHKTA